MTNIKPLHFVSLVFLVAILSLPFFTTSALAVDAERDIGVAERQLTAEETTAKLAAKAEEQKLVEGKRVSYEEILKDPDSILANIDEEIRQAVKRLSIRRRSVFLLKAVGDLSYIEISQVLDIPIGTVMGDLYRAREQLRKDLGGYARRIGILKKDGDSHEV